MKVIGHRGAKGYVPENTIEGINKAIELGADIIELDIQATKDGKIVLIHDKITPKGLVIKDRTLKTLQRELPDTLLLEKAFKAIGNKPVILDAKTVGTIAKAHKIIASKNNISIASFVPDEILSCRINLPKINTYLLKSCPCNSIKIAKQVDAGGVGYNWLWFTVMPYYYWIAQKNNLRIYVYTLNYRFIARVFNKLFPKLYIVSDYPDKIRVSS
ncbi:MAG: glycerophosphodiester phosphodiesterase [Patescibacteria group bacterium]|jgi:glycerophosphoryl diester phosphodiesterase|nr:glycerophosphodiester phosphodiesterase [Patescibacteria group bacterium]